MNVKLVLQSLLPPFDLDRVNSAHCLHTLDEIGIDLGGPFKEFLELMIKEVFRPDYGLFRATPAGHYYPNPNIHLVPGNDAFFLFFHARSV